MENALKTELIADLSKEIRMGSSDEVEMDKAVRLLENSIFVFEKESNKDQLIEYVQKQLEKHHNGDIEYAEHFILAGEAFLKYASHG